MQNPKRKQGGDANPAANAGPQMQMQNPKCNVSNGGNAKPRCKCKTPKCKTPNATGRRKPCCKCKTPNAVGSMQTLLQTRNPKCKWEQRGKAGHCCKCKTPNGSKGANAEPQMQNPAANAKPHMRRGDANPAAITGPQMQKQNPRCEQRGRCKTPLRMQNPKCEQWGKCRILQMQNPKCKPCCQCKTLSAKPEMQRGDANPAAITEPQMQKQNPKREQWGDVGHCKCKTLLQMTT